MAEKTTRAVAYIRCSTDRQAKSGLGLAAQRRQLRQYAELYGLEIVEVVVDKGVSAKHLRRPGLKHALEMIRSGDADALLVAKLDRLTRSVRDLGTLVDRYFGDGAMRGRRRGKPDPARLLVVAEQVDTQTAAGKLCLNVLMSVAQWERERIGERVRDAQAVKRARGEHVSGSLPYGERLAGDGRTLKPDPGEQRTLKKIFKLRADGVSYRGVADRLNETGVPARGSRWHANTVARIVARVP